MKILTNYILSTFMKIFAFVLPVFIGLYLVVEFVERIDDFLEIKAGMGTITLYFLLRIPVVGVQVGPLAILLSVALSVALLQRSREIMAFMAAGASPWHIIHPFLLGALVMAGASLGTEELILPGAHRALMDLQEDHRHPPPQGALVQQGEIWFRASETMFVHIELVDPAAERVHGITIYRRDAAGELSEQVEAREAVWRAGRWTLLDGTISRFQEKFPSGVETFTELELPLGMEPDVLRSMFTPPSQMSLSELQSYMRRLRGRGVDMTTYAQRFPDQAGDALHGHCHGGDGLCSDVGSTRDAPHQCGFYRHAQRCRSLLGHDDGWKRPERYTAATLARWHLAAALHRPRAVQCHFLAEILRLIEESEPVALGGGTHVGGAIPGTTAK